jgi:RNA polymerase sigma factor (sigma-70 family)
MTNEDAAAAYCRLVRPQLVGVLTLYCGDRHLAEELAQDTLVRIWDRWAQIERLPAREAYVHRMAINAANSRFRRLGAERRARARLAAARPTETDHAAGLAVRQAVAALPRRQRTVLALRYFVDLPVDEVALLMGCAPGTVKSLTSKAIAGLRRAGLVDNEETIDHA